MKRFEVSFETITEQGIYPAWGETENMEIEAESLEGVLAQFDGWKEDFIASLTANNSDYERASVLGFDLVKLDTPLIVAMYATEIEEEEEVISHPCQCGSGEGRTNCSAPNGWSYCG